MFNKSFLAITLIVALTWIGYVGFNLVNGAAQTPTPENVFGANDAIIVVHNTDEIDFNDSILTSLQNETFMMQLLHEPERVQHFYLSADFNKIILERSKPWTVDLIKTYFEKLALSVTINSDKTLTLSNTWHGQFSDKYLLLTKKQYTLKSTPSNAWKYIDRKSSYSTLKFSSSGSYKLANQYRVGNAKSSYFASSNTAAYPIVADQELFQEYTPNNLDIYEFYQKDYGKNKFKSSSIVFNWIDYGFALLIEGKDTCFISDFKAGQDPIATLEEQGNFTKISETKGTIDKGNFPTFNATKKLYVEVFNQVVFVAPSQNFLNSIIGAYETGNTLAQSETKLALFFNTMPKKVGYRKLTNGTHITQSFYNKTTCQISQNYASQKENKSTLQHQFQPLRLEGNLLFIGTIPGSDKLIVTTSNNMVYCIGKNHIDWSQSLSGTVQAKHVIVGNSVFIPTSEGIEGLSTGGQTLGGFPIEVGSIQANLYEYVWKGQTAVAYVSSSHFGGISTTGKKLYEFNHTLSNASDIIAIGKKGELIVHIANDRAWSIYNVNRRRKIKQFNVSEGTWKLNRFNNEISLIGISKQKLVRINDKNQLSLLIGNCSKLLRAQHYQGGQVYLATQNQTIYIVGENGGLITQFNTTLNNIEDAAIFRLKNGKSIVGLIDGIANNCYIYKENGNEINKENYEGSNRIAFVTQLDGTVVMLSQANGYFVRYNIN